MKKLTEFFEKSRMVIFVLLGVVLISMTMKTQVIVLSYGEEYSLRLEYTLYGYCIRASAGLKATEPAISNEVYIGNSINQSVLKAVRQLELLGGEGNTVGVFVSGYPRNTEKLEQQIVALLTENGKNAQALART